jgi:hypothetical protein
MHIALDLDDVLREHMKPFLDYLNLCYSTSLSLQDIFHWDLHTVWDCSPAEMRSHFQRFYRSSEFQAANPVKGAVHGVQSLRNAGHILSIVTSSPDYICEATEGWVNAHFPRGSFRDIYYTSTYSLEGVRSIPKQEICKSIGARSLVDDSVAHAKDCARKGIIGLLFEGDGTYGWNVQASRERRVIRVRNWPAVVAHCNR